MTKISFSVGKPSTTKATTFNNLTKIVDETGPVQKRLPILDDHEFDGKNDVFSEFESNGSEDELEMTKSDLARKTTNYLPNHNVSSPQLSSNASSNKIVSEIFCHSFDVNEKKYGLIEHKKLSSMNSHSVDVESELSAKRHYERAMQHQGATSRLSHQVQQQYADALEQDPVVFDYDAAYDSFHQTSANIPIKDTSNVPKYARILLQKAEERKKERENQFEKKIQRESEKEKETYGETESFVTSAYKEKLLEMKRMEEEERLREKNEDVTKKDMSDFYRNLLKNNISYGGGHRSKIYLGMTEEKEVKHDSIAKRPRENQQ